jgi:hypothetical protein
VGDLWDLDELIEHFTFLPNELQQVGNKDITALSASSYADLPFLPYAPDLCSFRSYPCSSSYFHHAWDFIQLLYVFCMLIINVHSDHPLL